MNWIKNNVAVLIGLVAWVILGIAGMIKLKLSNVQIIVDHKELKERVNANETEMRLHQKDTSIHIDPHRDEKRFDDFKTEIFGKFADVRAMQEETNRKIDRIQILQLPPQQVKP